MRNLKRRIDAISRTVTVIFVIVIIVAAGVGYWAFSSSTPSTPSTSSTSSSSSMLSGFEPANSSVLVEDSRTYAPDALDPATGGYSVDNWVFNNVFQYLVSFEGPNSTLGVVTPALAESYNVQNSQYFTFNIRPGVTFSNGNSMNAAVAWFSFVRNLYMGQGIVTYNFLYLTEQPTVMGTTGLSVPWGLLDAVQNVTGLPTTTNFKLAGDVLNNLLSNFDPNNATIQKIMSYPQQAYVVTGPMTFVIKLIKPYPSSFFLGDIAQWWAAIIDPAYVDAHGGVQANTADTYFNLNGGPGTGPYYIASIGTGFSTVLLKANPTYWGLHASNIPPVLQPPHIPVVVINYNLGTNERLEAFATNQAQIASVPLPQLGQMWSAYNYKQYTTFNQVFLNVGAGPNSYYLALNPGRFPTSNNDFRLAVVHAINYTELLQAYTYNGTAYAESYLGPLCPEWGKYYNPSNLPMYSYDIQLAISYMNKAGQEEHFSLTLPNGTVIGDTSAPALGPVELATLQGSTLKTVMTIVQSNLAQIGLQISVQVVTSSQQMTYTTIASTPSIMYTYWGPDWPDPVFQEIYPIETWDPPNSYMNLTQVNQLINSLIYETDPTIYIQGVAQLYNITYNYAPYIWLPNPDLTLLVQPYVHGMVYSTYTTTAGQYWFNTLYYSPITTSG